jgi:hypothetical protein
VCRSSTREWDSRRFAPVASRVGRRVKGYPVSLG